MQSLIVSDALMVCILIAAIILDFFARLKGAPILHFLSVIASIFFLVGAYLINARDSWIYVMSALVFVNMCSSIFLCVNSVKKNLKNHH